MGMTIAVIIGIYIIVAVIFSTIEAVAVIKQSKKPSDRMAQFAFELLKKEPLLWKETSSRSDIYELEHESGLLIKLNTKSSRMSINDLPIKHDDAELIAEAIYNTKIEKAKSKYAETKSKKSDEEEERFNVLLEKELDNMRSHAKIVSNKKTAFEGRK
jgi:hypothetical protein